MAKKKLCLKCKAPKVVSGAKGLCKACALENGFKACKKCNKLFLYKTAREKLCSQCRFNNQKGWNIGAWGQPGTGKNR